MKNNYIKHNRQQLLKIENFQMETKNSKVLKRCNMNKIDYNYTLKPRVTKALLLKTRKKYNLENIKRFNKQEIRQ